MLYLCPSNLHSVCVSLWFSVLCLCVGVLLCDSAIYGCLCGRISVWFCILCVRIYVYMCIPLCDSVYYVFVCAYVYLCVIQHFMCVHAIMWLSILCVSFCVWVRVHSVQFRWDIEINQYFFLNLKLKHG